MYKQDKFIFSPTKNYVFTKKETSTILKPRYTLHKISPLQNNFKVFRPVRPFNRFGKAKIYNTGIDPPSIFIDFINKDPDKSYKRHISPIVTKDIQYIPTSPLRWGLGCTKSCNRRELVAKYDPYKEYNFLKKINSNKYAKSNNIISYESEKNGTFEKTYLKTDHISIREPKKSKGEDKNINYYPFLTLKGEYNNTSNSNSFWVPRDNSNTSHSNKSSVDYNIINNLKDDSSGIQKDTMLNKALHNKKKGIEEFIVSQRPFGPNYNQTFIKLLREKGERFRKYNGFFTELYDSSIKNGNIFKPFNEKNKDELKMKNK